MTFCTGNSALRITTHLLLGALVCFATTEPLNGFHHSIHMYVQLINHSTWRIVVHSSSTTSFECLVYRTLQQSSGVSLEQANNSHRILVSKNRNAGKLYPSDSNFKNDEPEETCDKAFYKCMESDACTHCFAEIKEKDIDWTGVTADTDCSLVVNALSDSNVCQSIGSPTTNEGKIFCETFHTCVVFDDDDDEGGESIDCDALEKCEWEGKRDSLIGDGVCHDRFMGGCYNSKVCDYDGGDCCKDTCVTPKNSYLKCGTDGWMCRDPTSKDCDPTVTLKCPPSKHDNDNDKEKKKCDTGEALYRVDMRDSFGDGWDDTKLKVTVKETDKEVFTGQLEDGAEGHDFMCLSMDPTCYKVVVDSGSWGRESSWFVSAASPGSPTIASGGGLTHCDFPVAGDSCENTCSGRSSRTPSNTDDYTDLKEMEKCINTQCVIQKEACSKDTYCKKCVVEDVPEECYSLDSFKAVTDCALCKCSKNQSANAFCEKKLAPGVLPPSNKGGDDEHKEEKCSPMEVIAGGTAILEFGSCMRGYSITSMLTDEYDTNNFGELDDFEACAHGYNNKADHGGKTALDCVRKLIQAMDPDPNQEAPTKAIAEIAKLVHEEGETFCECTKIASDDCPLCPAFFNFKTLLYESLDACLALDQIDCAAWDEFQNLCRPKFEKKYGSIEFGGTDQCNFVHDGCDGAGPFPAFRRFDCKDELKESGESWKWYLDYEKKCLQDDDTPPTPPPPSPKRPVAPPTPHEVPKVCFVSIRLT